MTNTEFEQVVSEMHRDQRQFAPDDTHYDKYGCHADTDHTAPHYDETVFPS